MSSYTILELYQNTTIEERVSLLAVQVVEIEEDLTGVNEDVIGLRLDVNFLFDEQVIQDERLFSLEQTSNDIGDELDQINGEVDG